MSKDAACLYSSLITALRAVFSEWPLQLQHRHRSNGSVKNSPMTLMRHFSASQTPQWKVETDLKALERNHFVLVRRF